MAVKVGINGFGRIGRNVFRACKGVSDIEIVAINDLTDAKTLAHLLKYDSVHGIYQGEIKAGDGSIIVDGKEIKIIAERAPENLPWGKLGVDLVVESTGFFTSRTRQPSTSTRAPSGSSSRPRPPSRTMTVVLGVNDAGLDPKKHKIVSNASCTTNCLAPVAKVLNDSFGIVHGLMTTIHAYTNDQRILDLPHSDLRRARAAAVRMIPTSTGAAKAIGLVLPELKGKLDGISHPRPYPNVSVVDLTCELKKDTTAEQINAAMKAAADGPMKGYLQYTDEPIVSIDCNDNPHSSVFDSLLTKVMEGRMVKVISWYDNEWGYSNRVKDLILYMMKG